MTELGAHAIAPPTGVGRAFLSPQRHVQQLEVSVEYNGIVVYDPLTVRDYYGGDVREGENLFARYTTTDEGDAVLAAGLIVPVLAIDDAGYEVVVRMAGERHPFDDHVVHRNHGFALRVTRRALVTDLYSLIDWSAPASAEYAELDLAPGTYRVDVDAFSRYVPGEGIVAAGYLFTFTPRPMLPPVEADAGAYMRVLDQPSGEASPA